MKKITLLLLSVLFCACTTATPTKENTRLKVVTSVYPLAHFASEVGGDQVEIVQIAGAGIDPHDFEPTPQDIAAVYNADIFLFNGGELDAWAEKAAETAKKNGVLVIKMSEAIATTEDKHGDHIWLDPLNVQKEVALMQDIFARQDPNNKGFYAQNATAYLAKLSALDRRFREEMANCRQKNIITSHDAFNYLAHRYGFNAVSIGGNKPGSEPTPQELVTLIKFIKENNIHYVFTEPFGNKEIMETVIAETGSKMLTLYPLDSLTIEEMTKNGYISLMEANLDNLKIALECQ